MYIYVNYMHLSRHCDTDIFLTLSASTSLHHKLSQIRAMKNKIEEVRSGLHSLGEVKTSPSPSISLSETLNPIRAMESLVLSGSDIMASMLRLKPELLTGDDLDGKSLEDLDEQLQGLYKQRTDAYIAYFIVSHNGPLCIIFLKDDRVSL